MARALLHIGLEKTGTTSIQEFLQLNRKTLLEQFRIWVPDYLGRGSQWPLAVLAYANSKQDDLTGNLGSNEARAAKLDEIRKKITYSARNQPADVFCFSSEHLSSRLTERSELVVLKQFLDEIFDDVTAVVYVREPMRTAISRQSTFVKMGLGPFHLPSPAQNAQNLDFKSVIERWEAVFPYRLVVRLYDEDSDHFDLISDFSTLLGLVERRENLQRPMRVNQSLCWEHMRLLSRINEIAHETTGAPLKREVLHAITSTFEQVDSSSVAQGWAYRPSAEQSDAYHSYYAAQNQWLFATYFPNREHFWQAREPLPQPVVASQGLSLSLSSSEEVLCQVIVNLASTGSLPWAEIAEHLDQLAWKMDHQSSFNAHDQEASQRFAAEIKSSLSMGLTG